MNTPTISAALAAFVIACGPVAAEPITLHVSANGNDAWDGMAAEQQANSQTGPLASLTAARDRIRALRKAGKLAGRPVTVTIGAGTYSMSESFVLEKRDSGTTDAPITWIGNGAVRLLGGQEITEWLPVTDEAILTRLPEAARRHVVQCDLRKHGVTDFGRISPGGFGISAPPTHLELAWNGETMRVARSPNAGWFRTGEVPKTERVISGRGRGWKTDRFGYGDLDLSAWNASDLWVHGYWHEEWADQYLKVKRIDKASRQIVIAPPQSSYGYSQGKRFRLFNALEALDAPGEFYVSQGTGTLYFWPLTSVRGTTASVSVLQDPLIHLKDVSHVRMVGLTLASGRGDGVRIAGGSHVVLTNCWIQNMGNSGILIKGGQEHIVRNCRIHHLGGAGVTVHAGDRQALMPCNHIVEGCDIHHVGSWFRTYRPGVSMQGVGIVCRNNDIHDVPHSGIIYNGNDHLIEFNDIYHTSNDADDVGAIYTGRDWAARGTVIQYNYIHHVGGGDGLHGSSGIYLDDFASGQTLRGNIFYKAKAGISHNSGRENVFENNIFVECQTGLGIGSRKWAHGLIQKAKGTGGGWDMIGRLEKMPYQSEVWVRKYPDLVNILNENPMDPRNNVIRRNLFSRCETAVSIAKGYENRPERDRIKNNLIDNLCTQAFQIREVSRKKGVRRVELTPHNVVGNRIGMDLGFVDVHAGNFALREDSPALKVGFNPIPFDRIGRQDDKMAETGSK